MENNQNNTDHTDQSTRSGWQKYLYPALGVVVAVVLVWGLSQVKRDQSDTAERKRVNLSDEQRQALEAEVTDAENQIASLPANVSAEDRYRLHVKLASAKYNLGLYEEAVAVLDKVRDENQNQPALWQRYALIYRDMGDLVKARENARRAVDLDKTVPQYWITYLEVSVNESAETLKSSYQEALQSTENNIGLITAYAKFLETIGDESGAIEQWRRAAEVFPAGKADYDAEIARLQSS